MFKIIPSCILFLEAILRKKKKQITKNEKKKKKKTDDEKNWKKFDLFQKRWSRTPVLRQNRRRGKDFIHTI